MARTIQANRLVETENLSYEEWLDWRRKGIGSSEMAAVMGESPWEGQYEIFMKKRGIYHQEQNPEAKERMEIGRKIESFIADLFQEDWKDKLRVEKRNCIYQHPAHEWALANVDRVLRNNLDDSWGVLEIKNIGEFSARSKDWKAGPPIYYQIQVQHQLFTLGLDWGYLAALMGGNKFKYFLITRDQEMIDDIIAAGESFWQLMAKDVPPPPTHLSTDFLSKSFEPIQGMELELESNLVAEYLAAEVRFTEIENEFEAIKNRIKAILGPATLALSNGKKIFSWSEQKGRETIDTPRLKSEYPEIYKDVLKKGLPYRAFKFFKPE